MGGGWGGGGGREVGGERMARYIARVDDGSAVDDDVRSAVRYVAERLPVAIVSAAALEEIEAVVTAAALQSYLTAIVSADDGANGKPHPEPYLRPPETLGVSPDALLGFADTEAGVASAKA